MSYVVLVLYKQLQELLKTKMRALNYLHSNFLAQSRRNQKLLKITFLNWMSMSWLETYLYCKIKPLPSLNYNSR